ncbi:MAG: SIS domain-containing protein [Acidobacteriia bacterium]|nr:SIS domain-containing protein [Terriglobia bacterium]
MTSLPSAQTFAEILGQPRCWVECFAALRRQGALAAIRRRISAEREWLFVGCGSSYNIAQLAAATWSLLSGRPARAVAASEILLCPELMLPRSAAIQPVLISRSGWTSEVLRAGEFLEKQYGAPALGVVCEEGSPLEKMSAATLLLTAANDQSTAVTRAFTSTVLALQALAASYSGAAPVEEMIPGLAAQVDLHLRTLPAQIEEFVRAHDFEEHVFLGQGLYYGVAQEAMLKVMEMSCSYAQALHTLEFRHGPKAITRSRVLVTFFLSESGYEAERAVLEEIKELGATTLVVTNRADDAARRAADLLVELRLDAPDFLRPAAAVIPGQLLGYYLSLKKGVNADQPPHLSRVVSLTIGS